MRNPASIQPRATIGLPVKRLRMAFHWPADSGTILFAYWEVGGHWASPAIIQSRATIGPPVKIAVLSKLMTSVGQKIDGLIVVSDVCLFDCLQLVN